MSHPCTGCQFRHTDKKYYNCSISRTMKEHNCSYHPTRAGYSGREYEIIPPAADLNHRLTLEEAANG